MSWAVTRAEIDALLTAQGFTRGKGFWNVEKQPLSYSDQTYCITIEEMTTNQDGFGKSDTRTFPTQRLKISLQYFIADGSQDAYDAAIDNNNKIIVAVEKPDNRPTAVRIASYINSRFAFSRDQENYLLIDNYFDLQVSVNT